MLKVICQVPEELAHEGVGGSEVLESLYCKCGEGSSIELIV